MELKFSEAYLGCQQDKWISAPTHQILKVYEEVLTWLSHYIGKMFTSLYHYHKTLSLEAFGKKKGKCNPHSTDQEGGEEHPSACGQLMGQSVVMSFL